MQAAEQDSETRPAGGFSRETLEALNAAAERILRRKWLYVCPVEDDAEPLA